MRHLEIYPSTLNRSTLIPNSQQKPRQAADFEMEGGSGEASEPSVSPCSGGRHAAACVGFLPIWDFPKIRLPYFGVLIIRILLLGVLYEGPLSSETPM